MKIIILTEIMAVCDAKFLDKGEWCWRPGEVLWEQRRHNTGKKSPPITRGEEQIFLLQAVAACVLHTVVPLAPPLGIPFYRQHKVRHQRLAVRLGCSQRPPLFPEIFTGSAGEGGSHPSLPVHLYLQGPPCNAKCAFPKCAWGSLGNLSLLWITTNCLRKGRGGEPGWIAFPLGVQEKLLCPTQLQGGDFAIQSKPSKALPIPAKAPAWDSRWAPN